MGVYDVGILQEGYCIPQKNGTFLADCSITLLKGKHNVIVDTGGPKVSKLLIEGLASNGLVPGDVTHVVCTHGHSDHVGNLNLFPEALFIVSHDISKGNVYFDHNFDKAPYILEDGLEIFSTPGHTGSDVSVLVSSSTLGKLVVAGDLFESEADISDAALWREVSENPQLQVESRCRVIDMADIIIPGHGKAFKVTQEHREKCYQQQKDAT